MRMKIRFQKVSFRISLHMEADHMKTSQQGPLTMNSNLARTRMSNSALTMKWKVKADKVKLDKIHRRFKEVLHRNKALTFQASMVVLNITHTTITRITSTSSTICLAWICPTSNSSTTLVNSLKWLLDFKICPSTLTSWSSTNNHIIKSKKKSYNRPSMHPRDRFTRNALKRSHLWKISNSLWIWIIGTIIQQSTKCIIPLMSSCRSHKNKICCLLRSHRQKHRQIWLHQRTTSQRMRVFSSSRARSWTFKILWSCMRLSTFRTKTWCWTGIRSSFSNSIFCSRSLSSNITRREIS